MTSHFYNEVINPDNKLIIKLTSLSKEELNLELIRSAKIINEIKQREKKKHKIYLIEEEEEKEEKEKCNYFLGQIMKFCNL